MQHLIAARSAPFIARQSAPCIARRSGMMIALSLLIIVRPLWAQTPSAPGGGTAPTPSAEPDAPAEPAAASVEADPPPPLAAETLSIDMDPPAAAAAPSPSSPAESAAISFKPGRGLVITSADKAYEFGIGTRLQFLSITEHAQNTDARETLQIRRARLSSSGHIAAPQLKYRLELAFGPREVNTAGGVPQTSPLLDAVADWQGFRDVNVRVGQYKVPFDRQRIIPFLRLQFVDRAITDTEFTFDRDVGVDLHSDDLFGLGLFRYYLGIFTGDGRNTFTLQNFAFTYVARLEVAPFGAFDGYAEVDFERSNLRASLGAAYLMIDDAPRDHGILGAPPADGGTTDMQVATADLLLKFKGISALSAVFYRDSRRNPGRLVDDAGMPLSGPDGAPLAIAPSRDGVGFLAQAGYLLPGWPIEVCARYAVLDGTDRPFRDGLTRLEEFAAAINYYFVQHQLKLQANYTQLATNGDYAGALGRAHLQLQAVF